MIPERKRRIEERAYRRWERRHGKNVHGDAVVLRVGDVKLDVIEPIGDARKSVSTTLDPSIVRRFEMRIRKMFEGVVFELTVTRGLLMGNMIELTKLIVPDRNQGTGTAIMRSLCEFADRQRVEVRLTPASKGDYAATTSRKRLIRFYKRFGFIGEKVRPSDFRPVPAMVRPQGGECPRS